MLIVEDYTIISILVSFKYHKSKRNTFSKVVVLYVEHLFTSSLPLWVVLGSLSCGGMSEFCSIQ